MLIIITFQNNKARIERIYITIMIIHVISGPLALVVGIFGGENYG